MVSKLEPPRSNGGGLRLQPLRTYRDLEAYQRSLALNVRLLGVCKKLPADERYDLGNQMRQLSKSISANIAEGFTRKKSEKEFKQYMKMAIASANEIDEHLNVAERLGLIKPKDLAALRGGYDHVGQQLSRLIAIWGHF